MATGSTVDGIQCNAGEQLAYHHHPAGPALEREIAEEIEDLKLIKVFRANADSNALAKKFTFNVFA